MTVKDYQRFSTIAKPRFTPVAKEIGFGPVSNIVYCRSRGEWLEAFNLQSSASDTGFFYVNYGLCVPMLGVPWLSESDPKVGLHISMRLYRSDGHTTRQGFPCRSKQEISDSAEMALEALRKEALPWFTSLTCLKEVAAEYYRIKGLAAIGSNPWKSQLAAMNYGFLMLLLQETNEALAWLEEAQRLMSGEFDVEEARLVGRAIDDIKSGA